MARVVLLLGCSLMLCLITQVSSAPSYRHPARIITGIYSDAVAMLIKRVWSSISATSKPDDVVSLSSAHVMKFETGYTVETVLDGAKLGIDPYDVKTLPTGDFLVLDSANSNLYKLSSPLTLYSRPKLIAGSAGGVAGHVDGKLRDTKLNHPKGITADEKGNIYIADADNMVIRKISNTGITTIAGGKWGRNGEHKDGPSEDAQFSNDFDLVYVGTSCSLLVVDRGNKAVREIQLHLHDCTSENETDLPLGLVILVGSCFFGYMLALLQERLSSMFSSGRARVPTSSHRTQVVKSVRQPLIPTDDTVERPEQRSCYNWPREEQESFMIGSEDEAPLMDLRTHRKSYPLMSIDSEKMHEAREHRVLYREMESGEQYQYQYQHGHHHHHHHQKFAAAEPPHMFSDQRWNKTDEFEFGAVQEQVAKRKKHNRNQGCCQKG